MGLLGLIKLRKEAIEEEKRQINKKGRQQAEARRKHDNTVKLLDDLTAYIEQRVDKAQHSLYGWEGFFRNKKTVRIEYKELTKMMIWHDPRPVNPYLDVDPYLNINPYLDIKNDYEVNWEYQLIKKIKDNHDWKVYLDKEQLPYGGGQHKVLRIVLKRTKLNQ